MAEQSRGVKVALAYIDARERISALEREKEALTQIVYRYLSTQKAALEEYRRFIKGKPKKCPDLADVDADARALLSRLSAERSEHNGS